MQTEFWGSFKARHGWRLFRVKADGAAAPNGADFAGGEGGEKKAAASNCAAEISVLVRSFAKGLFSLAYIPMFPKFNGAVELREPRTESAPPIPQKSAAPNAAVFTDTLCSVSRAVKPFLPKNTICIRFDPDLSFLTPSERDAFVTEAAAAAKGRVKKNAVDIQPPDTTLVDLTRTEEEILAGMKAKWRYNINLAKRKGVQIEKWPDEPRNSLNLYEKVDGFPSDRSSAQNTSRNGLNLSTKVDRSFDDSLYTRSALSRNLLDLSEKVDRFYELYRITCERDGIAMHAKAYYEDLLKSSLEKIASSDGTLHDLIEEIPRVNLYIATHGGDDLGAIMVLNSKSESVYLYGCSSNVKRNLMPNFLLQWTAMQDAKAYGSRYYDMYGMPPTDDENHPMHGLYLFKTGFGGTNVHRAGTWDIPLKKAYYIAVFAEKVRAFWHKKVLKKIRGR